MVKRILIFLLFLVLKTQAQSIEVFATTDTTHYLVGDYIKYRVEITHTDDVRIDSIFVKDSVKTLDFISESPVQYGSKNGKTLEVYEYIFSKYDSTLVTVPEIPIRYYIGKEKQPSVIYTNEVNFTVSTLPVDTRKEIRDVKAPLKIQFDWLTIALFVLIFLLVAALVYYFYKRYKDKKGEKGKMIRKIIIPPHKEALKKLYELEDKKLWQQGKVKEYHSEITGIIREYFEKRFKLNALEQTSAEIIEDLKDIKEAGVIIDDVRHFLENADMVKFAKFEPMPAVNEQMMKQAYEIVNKTKLEEESKVTEEKTDAD